MKKTFLCILSIFLSLSFALASSADETKKSFIRWIDFKTNEKALSDAMQIDIETYGTENHIIWTDLLAILAVKYGGDFKNYKKQDLISVNNKLKTGTNPDEICNNPKLFHYYREAYEAILGGMVGEYEKVERLSDGAEKAEKKYGLRAFLPIASGYGYTDYDDFGVSRSYGYKRKHLGHDMMGNIGTPIIAVESGIIEACGWNQYGGWRVGIRSFDGKRYYYYAHLRKDHPFCDGYVGKIVNAGDVIGYLGMTGYSVKENVNNINIPHLHFGMEIIFDPSQKDGWNQIWIDVFTLTKFLSQNCSETTKKAEGENISRVYYRYAETPD